MRLYGDLALAAFFAEAKPKQREGEAPRIRRRRHRNEAIRYQSWLRSNVTPTAPRAFHGEIEFPRCSSGRTRASMRSSGTAVSRRERISTVLGNAYADWLVELHVGANSNADIVAHFFRRAFSLIRFAALRIGRDKHDRTRRHTIERTTVDLRKRRRDFPSDQESEVARRCGSRGECAACGRGASDDRVLDGTDVPEITAFLFHRGSHADPMRLRSNADRCFNGSFVLV